MRPAAAMIAIGVERYRPKTANAVHALLDRDGLLIVTSVWLSGAFTALGAVLGAGATIGAGLIGNRTQRGLAEASRKAQIADVRREAYAEYLTAVYSFMDGARELIAKLEGALARPNVISPIAPISKTGNICSPHTRQSLSQARIKSRRALRSCDSASAARVHVYG
jgi:hypothetical protein